jgi:hypothetical protein
MGGADHLGEPMSEVTDTRQLARMARCFGAKGRLQRWPSKRADQLLVLWVVWWQLPDDLQMSEAEVSAMLKGWHDYEDYALLRRELVDLDLMRRTPDGKVYRKISQDMPAEAEQLAAMFG